MDVMPAGWNWDDPMDADLLDEQADLEKDARDDAMADEDPAPAHLLPSRRDWTWR